MILPADSAERFAAVRDLLSEYAASLGFDLSFQGFEDELRSLPGDYAPPRGALLLAVIAGKPQGCVALRSLDESACEMKRLYVRPEARGSGLGRRLAEAAIAEARRFGYRHMRLDTVPGMERAQRLYAELGFKPIAAYRANPVPGAAFLELEIRVE